MPILGKAATLVVIGLVLAGLGFGVFIAQAAPKDEANAKKAQAEGEAAEADEDEEEAEIPWDQLPEAVRSAFEQAAPGVRPSTVSREDEDGFAAFEGTFDANGAKREITIGENGALIETEDPVALTDLPPAVSDALQKRHPKAEVSEVVKVTWTFYEADVRSHGKKHELKFFGNGQPVEAED